MAFASPPRLPRYDGPDPVVRDYTERLCVALERLLADLSKPVGRGPYVVTGTTGARTLDATASQTAQVLGTVISDLKLGGIVL